MSEYKDVHEAYAKLDDAQKVVEWQLETLRGKLNAAAIKQRTVGGGFKADYLEGWYVIDTLNRILGFNGWGGEVQEVSVGSPYQVELKNGKSGYKQGAYVVYKITANIAGTDVVKTGIGYGSGIAEDKADCEESAVKEAETDAMKRAARYLGNKFGNSLYDKQKRGVEK